MAPPHFNGLEGDTIRFLKSHGFNVTEETLTGRISIMRATKSNCSMIVMEGTADGSTRDVMRHVAAKMDRQFVVFRGKIYDEQPIWLTVTDDWFTRYLRGIGISQVEASPLMVAADLSCAAEKLPWTEL